MFKFIKWQKSPADKSKIAEEVKIEKIKEEIQKEQFKVEVEELSKQKKAESRKLNLELFALKNRGIIKPIERSAQLLGNVTKTVVQEAKKIDLGQLGQRMNVQKLREGTRQPKKSYQPAVMPRQVMYQGNVYQASPPSKIKFRGMSYTKVAQQQQQVQPIYPKTNPKSLNEARNEIQDMFKKHRGK